MKILLAALLCFLTQAHAELLKIGVIIPLSGPAASMGQSIQGAIGLVEQTKSKILFEDDQCDAKKALAAYRKLSNAGVSVFYVACSGSILAMAPLIKSHGQLLLTSYSGSAEVRKTGTEVIRFNPDAVSIADGLARALQRESPFNTMKHLALLHEEQDYASSMLTILTNQLADRLVAVESFQANQASYKAQLLKIKNSKADALIFIPVSDFAPEIIMKELQALKIELPLFGEVNLCDYRVKPSVYNLHGACLQATLDSQAFIDFKALYKVRNKRQSQYPFYDAISYDIFSILNQQEFKDVQSVKAYLMAGVQGPILHYSFDNDGEVIASQDYLHILKF